MVQCLTELSLLCFIPQVLFLTDVIHLTKEVDSDAQSPEETLQPAVTKVFQATGDPSAVDLVILT